MKRQTILLLGLLIFFVGIQFRMVESFTLSEVFSECGWADFIGNHAGVLLQNQDSANEICERP